MRDLYLDTSKGIEEWLETLTDKEAQLVNRGYLLGALSLVEKLVDTKTSLLRIMSEVTDDQEKSDIIIRIDVLDRIEEHYMERIKVLDIESMLGPS